MNSAKRPLLQGILTRPTINRGKFKLPDKSWTEEEIISLLEKTTGDSSIDASYARIKGLEELSKRAIKIEEKIADVLISMATKHGMRKP